MVFSSGCSEDVAAPPREMGKVTGKVTLDGVPLAGIEIFFEPTDGGGGSSSGIDAEGNYSLEYSGGGKTGALVGKHKVSFREETEEMIGDIPIPGDEEGGILPEKYTAENSTITREVASGEQVIDFELTKK